MSDSNTTTTETTPTLESVIAERDTLRTHKATLESDLQTYKERVKGYNTVVSERDGYKNTYDTEKATWTTREQALLGEITDLRVNTVLQSAIAEAEGNELFLLPHLKGRVKLSEVDGKFVVECLDENGVAIPDKKIADLVKDFRSDERFAAAFKSPIKAGGGATASAKATNLNMENPWAKETRNFTKQAEIEQNNPKLAAELKAAAK